MEKTFTAKKGYNCLILNNYAIVLSSDGNYRVFDAYSTNTNGVANFDEQPFINAFNDWQKANEVKKIAELKALEELKEQNRIKEENRISILKNRIEVCGSPVELATEFNLSLIETAGHWSDLYEGRSSYAVLITDQSEYEIIEMAIQIHGIEGEYGESRNKAGEHHSTFNYQYSLDEYQNNLKKHFNGDKYFYRSQSEDENIYLDKIKDAENIEDIKEIISEYDELESGYYDCNGNLEITEEALNDLNLTGYSEDVYTYTFCYRFDDKNLFSTKILDDEEI